MFLSSLCQSLGEESRSPECCFSFWPLSFCGNVDPLGKTLVISCAARQGKQPSSYLIQSCVVLPIGFNTSGLSLVGVAVGK